MPNKTDREPIPLKLRRQSIKALQHFARPLPDDIIGTPLSIAEMILRYPSQIPVTNYLGDTIHQALQIVGRHLLTVTSTDKHGLPNRRLGFVKIIDPTCYEFVHTIDKPTIRAIYFDPKAHRLCIPARAVILPQKGTISIIAIPEANIPGATLSPDPGTTFYRRIK